MIFLGCHLRSAPECQHLFLPSSDNSRCKNGCSDNSKLTDQTGLHAHSASAPRTTVKMSRSMHLFVRIEIRELENRNLALLFGVWRLSVTSVTSRRASVEVHFVVCSEDKLGSHCLQNCAKGACTYDVCSGRGEGGTPKADVVREVA